ncbi:hypothetical protein R1flu_002951 [Riccia fluitans]|uniref:G domain-containing protein n=1 Tax=Riccia fluitans TaxID=41844 RepID=A0ABD1Y7K8_9MARC
MGTDLRATYKDLASGNVFNKTLRILIIGRPGAGKSTMVRKIMGLPQGKGPESGKSSASGTRHAQDVNKEWAHPELPLKIHECDVFIRSASAPADDDKPSEATIGLVRRFLKRRDSQKTGGNSQNQQQQPPPEPKLDTVKKFLKLAAQGGSVSESAGYGLSELRKFLTNRQQRSDFSEHVHLVVYVASVSDQNLKDQAPILEEISNHESVPILLAVVQSEKNDNDEAYARNIQPYLHDLLGRVMDRNKVIENVVQVDLNDNESLARMSAKIQEHITSEDLQSAWAAAQGVDIQEKITLSAREIVGYKEAAILCSPAGLVPGPHQTIVAGLLVGLSRALCKIWGVPASFKRSLRSNLASEEVFSKQLNLLMEKIATMGSATAGSPFVAAAAQAAIPAATRVLATSVVTSISQSLAVSITPVALAAAAVGWIYASRNDASHSMLAMVSLGIMIVGAICYVKEKYDTQGWNLRRGKDEYDRFIQEFLTRHGEEWKQSVGNRHAISDVFNPEKDREQVVQQLIEYFDEIIATSRHEKLVSCQEQQRVESSRLQGELQS